MYEQRELYTLEQSPTNLYVDNKNIIKKSNTTEMEVLCVCRIANHRL